MTADTDDGSCNILGCTDNGLEINGAGIVNDIDGDGLAAENFNSIATEDDGSCLTNIVYGCINPVSFNYDSLVTINQVSEFDTSDPCIPIIVGCTDSTHIESMITILMTPLNDEISTYSSS